ncbi:CLIP domain-containing serine protease B15-like [Brevipalpus obovatus]|uniref:CLIP domain-containing serine protease B15-like n=1 Tax=Brevipalpus obovatus TaxID=246614 RepID=UPI003D9E3D9D
MYHFVVEILLLFIIVPILVSAECECGLERLTNRVYQGEDASNKYPWLSFLQIDKIRGVAMCGGSLIDDRHIVTAAHCVYDHGRKVFPNNVHVYLGINSIKKSDRPKFMEVSRIKVAKYQPNDPLHRGDFAILELVTPITFDKQISPICLPKSTDRPFSKIKALPPPSYQIEKLVVAGWGDTGGENTTVPLEAELHYITNSACTEAYKEMEKQERGLSAMRTWFLPDVSDDQICAKNLRTFADSCTGDSGGPLMYKHSNGRWYLVGVVSFGWGDCGIYKQMPGIYSSVAYRAEMLRRIAPQSCYLDY